jgi:ribokinase
MYDVITIGAATQDVFLQSEGFHLMHSSRLKRTYECFLLGAKVNVERIDFETGGGASNAATTFHNLGYKVGIVAKIGNDSPGIAVLNDLRERKIPAGWVRNVRGGATGYSSILLTPHGDRTALVHRGVSASFTAADVPWAGLEARWLFVTSLAGNLKLLKRLFTAACARGIQVAFNPGMHELRFGLKELRAHCGAAHVLLLNREEACMLAHGARDMKKIQRALVPHFRNAVIVTDAERGAYYWDRNQFLQVKGKKVQVVNSTGAGDAFGSGFISGILRWRDPKKALQLATLNACGTIRKMGAKRGLLARWPAKRELDAIRVKER